MTKPSAPFAANTTAKPSGSALTLVLLSTVAFAMKGLLAKYVYATGMTVDGLLLLRFLIAMPFSGSVFICLANTGRANAR